MFTGIREEQLLFLSLPYFLLMSQCGLFVLNIDHFGSFVNL